MKNHIRTLSLVAFLFIAQLSPSTARADSSSVSKRFRSSFAKERVKSYKDALADMQAVLRVDRENYVATLRIGWLSYLLGRHKQSVSYYGKADAIAPASIEAKLGSMLPIMAMGSWNEAKRVATSVLKVAPGNYLASSRLAWIYFSQRQYSKALATYKSVLLLYPSDVVMQLGLAWTYVQLGKKKDAYKKFRQIRTTYPDNKGALEGLKVVGYVH